MNRIIVILLSLLVSAGLSARQVDSVVVARLDSLLDGYCTAMMPESVETKYDEVDYLIGSSSDSLIRQHIALHLFDYYADSKLMGEEAVAIHIYDKWFDSGLIEMRGEFDRMGAEIFARFNRSTLIGMKAPVLELKDPEGRSVRLPSEDRFCALYFYEPGCAKCKVVSAALPRTLADTDVDMDLIAVYCGSDAAAWKDYRDSGLKIDNPHVNVIHLWDPEIDSDYQILYGVISTPRLYMLDTDGTVIGRRLEPENLEELLDIISIFAQ